MKLESLECSCGSNDGDGVRLCCGDRVHTIKLVQLVITNEKKEIIDRILYSMRVNGKQRVVSKWSEVQNTIMNPNLQSWCYPILPSSGALLPFEGSYQPGEAVCRDGRVFELGDIRESDSHIGLEVVRRREEHRCKEWKRDETAGHHRGLVS